MLMSGGDAFVVGSATNGPILTQKNCLVSNLGISGTDQT